MPGERRNNAGSVARHRLAASLRARGDQLVVLVVLIAIWQALSATLGTYWVGSPWGVATRFAAGIADGTLPGQASYTVVEAAVGFTLGALPAIALPFWLRRAPVLSAILDPFMVGGYGAPKLALAPLFILWFGIGIASKIALVASVVFFIVLSMAVASRCDPSNLESRARASVERGEGTACRRVFAPCPCRPRARRARGCKACVPGGRAFF